MQEYVATDPSRTIRRFSSHEEQEHEDLLFWSRQPVSVKVQAVAELAEYFARTHKIDIDAQGPKRIALRVQRS
jgi:hypothetical protein